MPSVKAVRPALTTLWTYWSFSITRCLQ